MGEKESVSSLDYELLDALQNRLQSEISITQPETLTFAVGRKKEPVEREGVTITISVQNTAPRSNIGGNVVFMGVGLRIMDGREGADSKRWTSNVSISSLTNRTTLLQKYRQGAWTSRRSFHAVTPDEQEQGDILFPGESIVYELKVPTEDLPYLDIKVEGTISSRHLFHVVHEMEPLKQLAKSLLVETFRDIDAINIYQPLLTPVSDMPEFGPKTTISDIENFRVLISSIIAHVDRVIPELNKVYHSAPNQELRDHIKKEVGQHLTVVKEACNGTLEALNRITVTSIDTQLVIYVAEGLKKQLLASEEIRQKQRELMASFGLGNH